MSKHTPKPWQEVYDTNGITRGIRGWHGPESVNVINWNGISRATSTTGQANARLIVAAPELLESLREMFAMWRSVCRAQGWEPEHLAEAVRAQAAIAKATGEQS